MSDVTALGKVGVLMGGVSSEREVSLQSAQFVYDALRDVGCDVVALDIVDDNDESIKTLIRDAHIDVAFIVLHGRLGEDGCIQRILEELSLPYTGSGVEANQRAFNKSVATPMIKQAGLPVPAYVVLNALTQYASSVVLKELGAFPLVVKPSCEGSSIGVAKVGDVTAMDKAVAEAFEFGHEVLIEQYIAGREITVSVLKDKPLPIVEIVAQHGFFDFQAKYDKQSQTEYIVPADLPDTVTEHIQRLAHQTFDVIGCGDYARVDFRLDEQLRPYILEVNTIPGMTSSSLLPKAAKEVGYSFDQLCLTLVECAYAKKKKESV